MAGVPVIVKRLNKVRGKLLGAVESTPADKWREPPRSGAWSVAEVIAHLTMVEGAITDGAIRMTRNPARPVPLWKRLHAPPVFAEWRFMRRETPIPLDPNLLADQPVMLSRLAALRQRTLAFLEEQGSRDLRAYRWPHPFLGSLNLHQWFEVVARHEFRHTKQIREIVEFFQK